MKKTTEEALVQQGPAPLVTYDPGLAAGDEAGMDNLVGSDFKVAFLAIAQKTSKALDATEEGKYIENLKFLDMYNSNTKEIYGTGPIQFIPVKMQRDARLKKEDGTLGERVDWNDPRVIPPWEPGSKVKSVDELEGVRIYNWAAVLVPSAEKIMLSFASTNFSVAKDLHGILDKPRQLARLANKGFRSFQVMLTLTTFKEKDGQNVWGKFKVTLAGGVTKDQYDFCAAWYEVIKDREVEVIEAEHQEAEATERAVDGVAEKVPF
jgi:hypothetical protein